MTKSSSQFGSSVMLEIFNLLKKILENCINKALQKLKNNKILD